MFFSIPMTLTPFQHFLTLPGTFSSVSLLPAVSIPVVAKPNPVLHTVSNRIYYLISLILFSVSWIPR